MVIEKINTIVLNINDIDDAIPGFFEALCDPCEIARNCIKRFYMSHELMSHNSLFDNDRTIRNEARSWIEEQLRARDINVPAFIFIEIDY